MVHRRAATCLGYLCSGTLCPYRHAVPHDAFFAIADEARRQNLPVAGHVPFNVTPQEAIDAGMTNIEHLSEGRLWVSCSGGQTYRPEACRPFVDTLARRRIWQTPTLVATQLLTIGTRASTVPVDQLAYASKRLRAMWADNQRQIPDDPDVRRIFAVRVQDTAAMTMDMANAGVPLLAGCDGVIPGFCLHDELATMVRAGMVADLILLNANPLESIANTQSIFAVIAAGRYMDRSDLDQLLTQVKEAAAQ